MTGDQPVTVMRIIDRLNVGGPAIHAVLTASGLDPARFRTVLVVGSVEPGEADMSYLLAEHGVTAVASIPSLGRELRPLRDLRTAWQLYRLMRRERPAIVHTHKAKAGAIGRAVAFVCRVPVRVHTYHGHVLRGYFGPMKSRMFTAIERGLARISSRLVTPAARLADELSSQFHIAGSDHFTVIPLGFDLRPFAEAGRYRGELRAELGVPGDARLVAIVGRMVPVKDHATFVAAGADLVRRDPRVRLVFVGGGELEAEVRADVERRGLTPHSHFLGWRRDLPLIYAGVDAVALSSVNEGTPVSLIEAMAAGVPVASTAVGGVPDVLAQGKRGELAPLGDPSALALAIGRALAPESAERARAIQGAVVEEYGAGRLCRDLERLYGELLDGKPLPS